LEKHNEHDVLNRIITKKSREIINGQYELKETVIGYEPEPQSNKYIPVLDAKKVLLELEEATKVKWENILLKTEFGDLPCYHTVNPQVSCKDARREMKAALGEFTLRLDDEHV